MALKLSSPSDDDNSERYSSVETPVKLLILSVISKLNFKILGLNGYLASKALREVSRALERTRYSAKEVAETLNEFFRLGTAELKRMGVWDD